MKHHCREQTCIKVSVHWK